MTDTDTDNTAPAPSRRGWHGAALAVTFIFAAAALAAAGWTWQQARRQAALEDRQDASVRTLQEKIDAQQRALGVLESATRTLQGDVEALRGAEAGLRRSLDSLVEGERQSGLERALAEAEYLAVLANHRIVLAHDTATALAALEAAHRRLTGISAAGIDDVRAQLASDIALLRDVHVVDLAGLSTYLADLSARADKLPFKEDSAAPQKASPGEPAGSRTGWRGIWNSFLRELRALVMIKRSGTPAPAVVLPEQRWFLVQNLRLQLETARLAVLKEDTPALRASISTALEWLDAYFDRSNGDVANAMESLGRMAELDLRPELPSLESSIETVRAYQHRLSDAADHAGSDAPSP